LTRGAFQGISEKFSPGTGRWEQTPQGHLGGRLEEGSDLLKLKDEEREMEKKSNHDPEHGAFSLWGVL